MFYVTDTHAFLWYLSQDSKLSKNAKAIFDLAEKGENTIIVPTIVLAESLHILEKERSSIKFQELVRLMEIGSNYTILPLDLTVIKKAEELKLPELHDRIVAASAAVLNVPLITKDKAIIRSGYVKTIW